MSCKQIARCLAVTNGDTDMRPMDPSESGSSLILRMQLLSRNPVAQLLAVR